MPYIEAAFSANPQRVKNHIPRYHSSGSGRDFYVKDAQMKIDCIPMTADVYRAGTFRRPRRRTKELNYPPRPPRYIMDGSGRDGFVFLHGDVGQPKKAIFRNNKTPWAKKSTAPYSFDPHVQMVVKCSSLRLKPCSTGVKVVSSRPFRPRTAASLSPRMQRRAQRQRKQSNRLSTPIQRLVVAPGTYKGNQNDTLLPWVGNSVRATRPASAAAAPGKLTRRRRTAGEKKSSTFRGLDPMLLT
jgi:hypothetical protein